jgi:hypothetical protein
MLAPNWWDFQQHAKEQGPRGYPKLLSFSDTGFPHLSLEQLCHHFGATGHKMKLPHFSSRKEFEKLSTQDEQVFAEASELAVLRLEQCIADLRISAARMRDTIRPAGLQPSRKYTNPF